jgi:serine/threonine-protein kinase
MMKPPEAAPERGVVSPAARPPDETASTVAQRAGGAAPGWQGRFAAGTILAGRYRIVAVLGRGGMGEVWRADDLKLRQTVALKFLPEGLAADASRLARLVEEVRLARLVSHPSVCRVHDLVESEGQHFVTMEYVDGEDLRSLLRRVGRLPTERSVELIAQICGGLAAAHEGGVLHRDLKPANVLIDGRGRARITDFGLAITTAAAGRPADLAGTPTYMAPEQRDGRPLTARTDVYALGHLLREMLTGVSPSGGVSHPTTPPPIPLELERLIERCLAHDPELRPPSALAVAAALPGRDVLAALLAAGETPPPEIVAAAGTEGGLSPPAAWACVAFLLVTVPLALQLGRETTLFAQVPLPKPPAALAERARDMLARLGHAEPRADEAYGFAHDEGVVVALATREGDRLRAALDKGRPAPIQFWYRAGTVALDPRNPLGNVTRRDPPPGTPGVASLRLDTMGRLLALEVVAPRAGGEPPSSPVDWGLLLEAAGLDPSRLESRPPGDDPPLYADARAAWEGTTPEPPHLPVHLEAAALRGRPVWLERRVGGAGSPPTGGGVQFGEMAFWSRVATLFWVVLPIGLVLAVRNLRLGRADRAGAERVALVVFAAFGLVWLLSTRLPVEPFRQLMRIASGTGYALWNGAAMAVFYLASEPALRRRWPELLISWSRLLAGRWRDPRVGRDMLVGLVLTFAMTVLIEAGHLVSWRLGGPAPRLVPTDVEMLGGVVPSLSVVILGVGLSVGSVLSGMVMILVLLLLLRRRLLVALAMVPLCAAAFSIRFGGTTAIDLVAAALAAVIYSAAVYRYGVLVALAPSLLIHVAVPPTLVLGAWYGTPAVVYLLVVAALAIYGFRASLGRRPAFSASFFGD